MKSGVRKLDLSGVKKTLVSTSTCQQRSSLPLLSPRMARRAASSSALRMRTAKRWCSSGPRLFHTTLPCQSSIPSATSSGSC